MEDNKKAYKLGGLAASFYDPSQPSLEDQNLSFGQVKWLVETERVNAARKAEGLVRLSDSEQKEHLAALEASKQSAASIASDVDSELVEENAQLLSENKALLNQIDKLNADKLADGQSLENIQVDLRQAKIRLKDADSLQLTNEELGNTNKSQAAEIEALKKDNEALNESLKKAAKKSN